METLSYQAKDLLPGVILDKESGRFQIFGKSCPVNAFEFYDPIFDWLDEYTANPLKKTVFDLKLSYFNTVSSKFILRIMAKLKKIKTSGNEVKIRWFYIEGDDEMEEAGEEFGNIANLKFEMIPLTDITDELTSDDYFDSMMDDIL